MAIRAVYLDWNRTVLQDPDEKPLFGRIAKNLLVESLYPTGRVRKEHRKCRFFGLLRDIRRMKGLYEKVVADGGLEDDAIRAVYEEFNRCIADGMPLWFLRNCINEYAQDAAKRLDRRVLDEMKAARSHGQNSVRAVIIGPSSAYEGGIRQVLSASGDAGVVDRYIANQMEKTEDGTRLKGFRLDVLDPESKKTALEADIQMRGLEPKEVGYMGDNYRDASILHFLAEHHGLPMVSLMATDDFKQEMAKTYDSHVVVLEKPSDIRSALRSRSLRR